MTTTRRATEARLEEYGRRARREALTYLDGDIDAEHLRDPAADYLLRPGKALRPALCLSTCGAFGGEVDRALPTAAALELFHTAFLVHDDVEDDSDLRRGLPTLHRRYGQAVAVNTGDALIVFGLAALDDNRRVLGRRLAARLVGEFQFMARHTVEGQAMELGWQRGGRLDLTPDDYLDLIMKKTCWYTTVLPLRAGALIGGHRPDTALVRFGFFLGAAFQIRDDVLNLTGGARYGKEILGDIREGKRTLMLIHLLTVARRAERQRLERFLRLPPGQRTATMVEDVAGMMHAHGSIGFAEEFGRGIARSASMAFEEAFGHLPDSPEKRFIADLADYMVERDR